MLFSISLEAAYNLCPQCMVKNFVLEKKYYYKLSFKDHQIMYNINELIAT